jgi:hypothetical protein
MDRHQGRRLGEPLREIKVADQLGPIVFGIDHAELGRDFIVSSGRLASHQQ